MTDLIVRLTAALAVAGLATLAMRRHSAAARHHVWLVALLALPVVAWAPRLAPLHAITVAVQTVGAGVSVARSGDPPMDWVRVAWLAGTLLLLARLGFAHWICARLRVRPDLVKAPMAYGLLRPAILLPEAARDWPEAMRDAVVAHEQAHLDRHDLWTQLAIEVVTALFWWHPLVWFARRQAMLERERACDDRVIAGGVPATDYATHLLAVARHASAPPVAALSTTQLLERRLNAMLDASVNRSQLGRREALAATAGLLVFVAPAALLRAEEEYYSGSEVTEAPRLLHKVEPNYSEAARDAKVAGKCVLDIGIDKEGIVGEAKVIEPLHPDLDLNAIEAVKQWTFRPGMLKGKPVGVRAKVEVIFRLR